jgi:hypothetical protein
MPTEASAVELRSSSVRGDTPDAQPSAESERNTQIENDRNQEAQPENDLESEQFTFSFGTGSRAHCLRCLSVMKTSHHCPVSAWATVLGAVSTR